MPLKKTKSVSNKDSKSELELRIQSIINSSSSLIMPVKDQTVIHIKDPVSQLLMKLNLDSKEYFEMLDSLIAIGLESKLHKDFQEVFKYAPNYTHSWNSYKAKRETTLVI